MKKLLLLVLINLITIKLLACVCEPTNITHKFLSADFVAIADIKETFNNEKGKDFYRVNLNVNQLYKGDKAINSINVGGYNGVDSVWSSCDIKLISGSKWLIFGYKNQDGDLVTGMCSVFRAEKFYLDQLKALPILETLQNQKELLKFNYSRFETGIEYNVPKTYITDKISDYMLVAIKLDSTAKILNINSLTNDTNLARQRVEKKITEFNFKNYLDKHKISYAKGYYYVLEIYPYTSTVEPILKLKY
ncbi:hypothetical protein QWY86_15030 [Pedobacter aquatilis]|uniref:hypothetical protein n=1 Tax=Pedobacter aquatilis TaxID=351343 RepID=UPI0025B5D9BF|nr:hypothetical protein [Pedobacter aquatilis]MDN3587994.1 hypothetical protein [Pedobacter aquatilis]